MLGVAQSLDFLFEFVAVAGPGDVADHLLIRNRVATLIHEPSFPSVEGDAIGVYRATLTIEQQNHLANVVPDRLIRATEVRPDTPSFSILLRTAARNVKLLVPNTPEG